MAAVMYYRAFSAVGNNSTEEMFGWLVTMADWRSEAARFKSHLRNSAKTGLNAMSFFKPLSSHLESSPSALIPLLLPSLPRPSLPACIVTQVNLILYHHTRFLCTNPTGISRPVWSLAAAFPAIPVLAPLSAIPVLASIFMASATPTAAQRTRWEQLAAFIIEGDDALTTTQQFRQSIKAAHPDWRFSQADVCRTLNELCNNGYIFRIPMARCDVPILASTRFRRLENSMGVFAADIVRQMLAGTLPTMPGRPEMVIINVPSNPPAPPLREGTVLPAVWSQPAGVPSVRALHIPVVGAVVEVRLPIQGTAIRSYIGGSYEPLRLPRGYYLGVDGDGLRRRLPENRNFISLKEELPMEVIVGPALQHRIDKNSGELIDVDASITVDNWKSLWA
jgi:hypothetical protein